MFHKGSDNTKVNQEMKEAYDRMANFKGKMEDLSTPELMKWLKMNPLLFDLDIAREITSREDALFNLKKVLQDGDNWRDEGIQEPYFPVVAIHLLGMIRTEESIEFMLDLIRFRGHDLGDWLAENVPWILCDYGRLAVPYLEDFIQDWTIESITRLTAFDALYHIAAPFPDIRREVLDLFPAIFIRTLDEDEDIAELMTISVAWLNFLEKDEKIRKIIFDAFDSKRLYEFIVSKEEIASYHDDPEYFITEEAAYHKSTEDFFKDSERDLTLPGLLKREFEMAYKSRDMILDIPSNEQAPSKIETLENPKIHHIETKMTDQDRVDRKKVLSRKKKRRLSKKMMKDRQQKKIKKKKKSGK